MFRDSVLVPSRRVKMPRLRCGLSPHPVIPVEHWDEELCTINEHWMLLVPTGGLTQ